MVELHIAGEGGLIWGHPLLSLSPRTLRSYCHHAHIRWLEALRSDPCAYCTKPGGSIDHIIPRCTLQGTHWENKTGACRRCNSHKSDMPLLVYLVRHHPLGRSISIATTHLH